LNEDFLEFDGLSVGFLETEVSEVTFIVLDWYDTLGFNFAFSGSDLRDIGKRFWFSGLL
jgi:hypothetical protein